eukprot:1751692-Prorocentrum_lima.AAC.1
MTSSLVGSEMCIRDRSLPGDSKPGQPRSTSSQRLCARRSIRPSGRRTVSYTHLTLPTSVDLGGR